MLNIEEAMMLERHTTQCTHHHFLELSFEQQERKGSETTDDGRNIR